MKLLRETDPALEKSASITEKSLLSAQTTITHVAGTPKLTGEDRVLPSNVSGNTPSRACCAEYHTNVCLQNLYSPEGKLQQLL